MSTRQVRCPPRGFTLIELLIGLAIMALLSVLGYRAIASLADTQVRLAHESQRWRALDFFLAHLEGDCRQAVPRPARVGSDVQPAFVAGRDASGNALLVFSRAGSEFILEPGSAGQRIGYRLREGRVEILYWSGLDPTADATPTAYPLVDGIAGLSLAFLDSRGAWQDRWPIFGEAILPRGVRVALELADGARIERIIALQ
ncbi:MAG: type II secretion system minor pseudopilin GspJ [Casimicrobiaceae bacterium]